VTAHELAVGLREADGPVGTLIEGRTPDALQVEVATRLIVRDSTAPPQPADT
jgi:hypothetical protein